MQVLCLLYGLKVFYSEDNRCNWEGRHSIGYVVMFMDLTLGMILVFKWFVKLAEMLLILLSAAALKLISILRRRPGVNLREPLMMRLRQPLQPDIYQVEAFLRAGSQDDGSLDPRSNPNIASLYFRVKISNIKQGLEGQQCAICLEEMDGGKQCVSLPCDAQRRHSFHEGCLKAWLQRKHECPLCKHPLQAHRASWVH